MKLLQRFDELVEAELLSAEFRKKGILTFISSKGSHALGRHQTGAIGVGVWAVLENQYEDAVSLIHNSEHVVKHPLTEMEMVELERTNKEKIARGFNSILNKVVVGFLVVLVSAFFAFVLIE